MMWRELMLLRPVDRWSRMGVPLFRLFIGAVLVFGTADNVFGSEHMLAFRDFLAANGFPLPHLAAYVSAYAQFIAGLLIVLGAATRLAAAAMAVNFVVALAMVHVGLPFSANIAPLAMLFGSVLLFLHGPGAWSLDALIDHGAGGPARVVPEPTSNSSISRS